MPEFVNDNHLYYNPVEFVMDKIGGTYKMPILWRLKDKNWRYSELKHSIHNTSDKMLSKSLKELEMDGFISKQVFAEVPVRTEYSITDRGMKTIPVITSIRNFGLMLMEEIGIKEK